MAQSPTAVIDFLKSLAEYKEMPMGVSTAVIDKLSYILQEAVIRRISQVGNIRYRFETHLMACKNLV